MLSPGSWGWDNGRAAGQSTGKRKRGLIPVGDACVVCDTPVESDELLWVGVDMAMPPRLLTDDDSRDYSRLSLMGWPERQILRTNIRSGGTAIASTGAADILNSNVYPIPSMVS